MWLTVKFPDDGCIGDEISNVGEKLAAIRIGVHSTDILYTSIYLIWCNF